jgi:hypothetical protein
VTDDSVDTRVPRRASRASRRLAVTVRTARCRLSISQICGAERERSGPPLPVRSDPTRLPGAGQVTWGAERLPSTFNFVGAMRLVLPAHFGPRVVDNVTSPRDYEEFPAAGGSCVYHVNRSSAVGC